MTDKAKKLLAITKEAEACCKYLLEKHGGNLTEAKAEVLRELRDNIGLALGYCLALDEVTRQKKKPLNITQP